VNRLAGNAVTVDFAGGEYYTARLGLHGNTAASPVDIGDPVYTHPAGKGGSESDPAWTFNDNGVLVDQGHYWIATNSSNSVSLALTGDTVMRTVSLYLSMWNTGGGTNFVVTAGGTTQNFSTPNKLSLHRIDITFTGSVVVQVRPQSTRSWSQFNFAAAVVN
jgi:hypothetical protein